MTATAPTPRDLLVEAEASSGESADAGSVDCLCTD